MACCQIEKHKLKYLKVQLNLLLIDYPMCGGVGYKTKNIPEAELKKYYSQELIKRFKKEDRVESFFWHDRATLPIKRKGKTQLVLWGNKDKAKRLPPTGWAREESLKEGQWDYLHPEAVDIPVDEGYEQDFRGI